MTVAHSSIGASSMERWSACPGSVRLSDGLVSPSSPYAEEGTAAHALAAAWLVTGHAPECADPVMRDAVQTYVDYVAPKQVDCQLYFEHRFDLSSVHPGCFGTADCVVWNADTRHLEVIDFKYGAGVFVSAVGNPQLRYYGLGALLDLKLPARTIQLTIVQPRYDSVEGPIRSETLDLVDLCEFMADLKRFALATEDPHAPLVPGEQCRWCPAKRICPELAAATQAVAKTEFSPVMAYDPGTLARALAAREYVKAWLKMVDEFAYEVLEQGGEIPGYKLVEKRPTRKWKSETDAEIALHPFSALVEIYEPKTLKSPAQMEKLIKDKAVLAPLIESISAGHTVVEMSDKRPAVKSSAKQDFTAIPAAD